MAATPTQNKKRRWLASMAAAAAGGPAKPELAIRAMEARAVREPASGRAHLIVEVHTEADVTGVGEAPALPDAAAALSRLRSVEESVIGQDALAAEALRVRLAQAHPQAEDALVPVQAALNMALLDILGKRAEAPLYEALGGPTRQKARALAHLHGGDKSELLDSMAEARAGGYRAFLVPLAAPQGPTRGREFYRSTVGLLEALREKGGEESDFVLDCRGALTAAEAAGLAAALEGFHLLWLEQPADDIGYGAFQKLAAENVTPIGAGRGFSSNAPFQDLLRLDAVDVLRPDVARLGVSGVRKAAALAETYYVAVAPFHRGGPIATAAALHAAASMPNFFIQEIPRPRDSRDLRMRREIVQEEMESPEEGFLPLPQGPGLGVTLNADAVHRYEVVL